MRPLRAERLPRSQRNKNMPRTISRSCHALRTCTSDMGTVAHGPATTVASTKPKLKALLWDALTEERKTWRIGASRSPPAMSASNTVGRNEPMGSAMMS